MRPAVLKNANFLRMPLVRRPGRTPLFAGIIVALWLATMGGWSGAEEPALSEPVVFNPDYELVLVSRPARGH